MAKLSIESNPIDVTPSREPDPSWEKECKCGIVHFWHSESKGWPESPGLCDTVLPTLKFVIDEPASDDYPAITHYECDKCGEEIEPEWRTPLGRYHIKGRTEYFVNDVPVSEEEFMKYVKNK